MAGLERTTGENDEPIAWILIVRLRLDEKDEWIPGMYVIRFMSA